MTPLEKTQRKFTNLLDGGIINGVSVRTIINYYEAQKIGQPVKVVLKDNFLDNFIEEEIKEIEENQ